MLKSGWTVRGSNPGGGARLSASVQTGPGAHPASCTMGTGSFTRVKSGRGVTLTPHPLLAPWSWKSRVIPLLPLWAVEPVQSLSACARVHFTLISVYVHFVGIWKIYLLYEKYKGMGSFRTTMPSFVEISHVIWSLLESKEVAQRGINKIINYFQM